MATFGETLSALLTLQLPSEKYSICGQLSRVWWSGLFYKHSSQQLIVPSEGCKSSGEIQPLCLVLQCMLQPTLFSSSLEMQHLLGNSSPFGDCLSTVDSSIVEFTGSTNILKNNTAFITTGIISLSSSSLKFVGNTMFRKLGNKHFCSIQQYSIVWIYCLCGKHTIQWSSAPALHEFLLILQNDLFLLQGSGIVTLWVPCY